MAKRLSQNLLYQKRSLIKQSVRPFFLSKNQKNYLRTFARKNKKLLFSAFILIIGTVFLEVSIPLILHFAIEKNVLLFKHNIFIKGFLTLTSVLVIYLFISYFQIQTQKTFIVHFLNKLRENWFAQILSKKPLHIKHYDKAKLLTKISYHFGLVQMGIQSTFFPAFEFLTLLGGLFFITAFLGIKLIFFLIGITVLNILIMFIGYIISKYYVSKDQTLYSKILMYISNIVDEFHHIKLHNKEKSVLKNFKELVDIDTFFRIKRELWMKFGRNILAVSVSFVIGAGYILEMYYPFLTIANKMQGIVYTILLGLIIKLLYYSLQIGLYSFPLRLGLFLCVPEKSNPNSIKTIKTSKNITFQAKNKKLFFQNKKQDSIFNFIKGERILFQTKNEQVKDYFFQLFSGNLKKQKSQEWVVKMDGNQRLLYNKWSKLIQNIYFISPSFQSELSFSEILNDIDQKDFSQKQIFLIMEKLSSIKELSFLFDNTRSIAHTTTKHDFSFIQKALLQMAYCLLYPPDILLLDSVWLDINNSDINSLINILHKKLKKTTIICFSSQTNTILPYDQKHII